MTTVSRSVGTNFWEKPELHESRVDLFPVLVCFGRINKVTETLNKTENNLLRNARESFIYTYFLYFVFYIILWHRTIIRRTPLLIFIAVCGRAKSSLRLYGSNRWLRYLYREGANLLYLRHYLVLDFDERELVSQEDRFCRNSGYVTLKKNVKVPRVIYDLWKVERVNLSCFYWWEDIRNCS